MDCDKRLLDHNIDRVEQPERYTERFHKVHLKNQLVALKRRAQSGIFEMERWLERAGMEVKP